jgi:predicted dehydrogenase
MKSNRRDFLRFSGLAGISLVPASFIRANEQYEEMSGHTLRQPGKHFNMSGFAAPKLETVRIGFIGLGNRGPGAVERMSKIEGVDIKGLCDLRPERANAAKKQLDGGPHKPEIYTGNPEEWKKMCDSKDIDLIYIATPWYMHTPMAVYAMNAGKHVCTEVPAATSIEECWQLVETSERTRKHCIMLENCNYDFFELMTLNMTRQGFFGELIHGEGAYIHDLLDANFEKGQYWDMWRLKANYKNGDLYPTHGLGPVAQAMDINRGDKFDYMVSLSSNDFQMGAMAKDLASKDDFYKEFANKKYRGNMNTSVIKTAKGKSIMVQHDVTSPRVYSRIHLISGTKGSAQKYPLPGRIALGHKEWLSDAEMKDLTEKFEPAIVKKVGELAKKIGGHGGMDFMMDWHTIDCLRNGLPMDMDVYDAAALSSVVALSEKSVSKRSTSVDFPDFTSHDWKTNKPVDISLTQGGNTGVKA